MNVLILEPHANGHHAVYLRWIVQAASDRGWKCIIASTRQAYAHPGFSTPTLLDRAAVEPYVMDDMVVPSADGGATAIMRREYRYWNAFRTAYMDVSSRFRIDGVVLPYLEYCFHSMAMLGSPFGCTPWTSISMRLQVNQRATDKKGRPVKWHFADRLLRDRFLRSLWCINPSIEKLPPHWLDKHHAPKLQYVADPADEQETRDGTARQEARRALGLATGKIAILGFGYMNERKGVDRLVKLLAGSHELDDYVLILAGTQSKEFRIATGSTTFTQLIEAKRLILMNHFLNEAEQNRVFAASDIVWVGYVGHPYMSGVLALAGRAGLPVLGTRDGEIGYFIERYGTGKCVDVGSNEDIERALVDLRSPEVRNAAGEGGRNAFANHTPANLGRSVLGCLE